MSSELLTIGYSTHTCATFLAALRKYKASCVVDVRTAPYSRFKPEFDWRHLHRSLRMHSIESVFLGDHFGARPKDPECYVDGSVSFERLAEHPLFARGVERILDGMTRFRIAMMCAEKDPIQCHRMVLVSRRLCTLSGVSIRHILANGSSETHKESELRMMRMLGLEQQELFGTGRTHQGRLAEAYRRQGKKIAYSLTEGREIGA